MRQVTATAALVLALALGVADAGLQTRSMDALRDEVAARDAALTGELTRAEKRLKKQYARVLAQFDKESASRKQDAKRIAKIGALLARPAADDAVLGALVADCVDTFVGEIDKAIAFAERGQEAVGEQNRHRAKAEKALGRANDAVEAALGETSLRKKLRRCTQAEVQATLARQWTNRALGEEPDLSPHQTAFLLQREAGYGGTSDCLACHADECD